MALPKYKPGEKVLDSGIYSELTLAGSKLTEVTCVKNEVFSPTQGAGYHYEAARLAKHRHSER